MKRWRQFYQIRGWINDVRIIVSRRCVWHHALSHTFALIVGLIFCCLWRSQPLFAATIPGADPTRPLFPTDSWLTLADEARHWYAFRDEGDGAPIVVRLTVIPEEAANFAVFTPAAVQAWQRGEPLVAVGEGNPLTLSPNDRYWTGSFVQSGTYYVLVQSRGTGSSSYRLTIDGRDVSFPILSFKKAAMSNGLMTNQYPLGGTPPTALPSTPTAEPTAAPTLSSPEKPLPPIGKAITITIGETHWYAFRDEGDAAMIQVSADATPDQCLTFQVWAPEQFARWQQGEEVKPVGQGTVNPTLKADLFWTGSFVKSGIYYVVVKPNPAAAGPCTYKLLVLGDDVSLVLPATQ